MDVKYQIATTVQDSKTAWSTVQTGILQVHRVDQTLLPAQVDSFVGCSLHCALHPPAEFMIGVTDTKKQQNEQKFYIYSDVSHTHINDHKFKCTYLHTKSW